MPDEHADTFSSSDHARDRSDHGGDRDDHAGDRGDHARDQDDREGDHDQRDTPNRQFAKTYPDPNGPGLLQVWPWRKRDEFNSDEEFWKYMDAFSRWNNGLPPPRSLPTSQEVASEVPKSSPPRSGWYRRALKSRHVGIRLTERDYELLTELAREHAVALGTMARMLVVRGVRAAAERDDVEWGE
jgi:hypothetical protein